MFSKFCEKSYRVGLLLLLQLVNSITHGRACLRIPLNTSLNKSSENTIHSANLIAELLGIRLLADAHFTQQHTKTIHVHLAE